ncbi:MAG TPA: acyl-CoA dehydrogenase family protein [Candidatus Binatia bacterium]|nr:acyl-CoA dehydrogenase family protein [Candidatus Binatia bacterium]
MQDQELELFRDNVRRFLAEQVAPHYEQWEKAGITPRSLWNRFGEAGLLCVDAPVEYGGIGAPFEFSCVVLEEIGRMGFGALGANLAVHSDIVTPYLVHLGTEEQKRKYVPKLVTGEIVGAIAMTEPGAGSDLQGIKTAAAKSADGYVINGSKTFITNGQHADVVITFTKTDPKAGAKGTTLFLVDAATPGFSRGRNLEKLGQHAGDTSELFYADVKVPAGAILGREGNGFGHLIDELPRERLTISMAAVGAAEGALALTLDYVRNRKAFGQAIGSFQNTRFELAQVKTDIEVTKAYVHHCAALYAKRQLDVPTAAMCKLAAAETQFRVADRCLQLFGGYGYMTEYPIARHFADARVQRIYGGTSEIMKEVIARSLLGR